LTVSHCLILFGVANAFFRGQNGKGTIHHHYGGGEYLDVLAIRQARVSVSRERVWYSSPADPLSPLGYLASLPVEKLILEGFVVDALSFQEFFVGLKQLTFTDCIDAGFFLPLELEKQVTVVVNST